MVLGPGCLGRTWKALPRTELSSIGYITQGSPGGTGSLYLLSSNLNPPLELRGMQEVRGDRRATGSKVIEPQRVEKRPPRNTTVSKATSLNLQGMYRLLLNNILERLQGWNQQFGSASILVKTSFTRPIGRETGIARQSSGRRSRR